VCGKKGRKRLECLQVSLLRLFVGSSVKIKTLKLVTCRGLAQGTRVVDLLANAKVRTLERHSIMLNWIAFLEKYVTYS